MLKLCTNCTAEYYARWRNEPTTFCPACRADVILCAACQAIVRPASDASQLTLWPNMRPTTARHARMLEQREPHHSHGKRATQAERRRYPYH